MSGDANVFLACVLVALVVCSFWREILATLLVLGIASICMAIFYIALGVQSIAHPI